MKKILTVFFVSLLGRSAFCQAVDTNYHFESRIIRKVNRLNSLDTLNDRNTLISFRTDSADTKYLFVSVTDRAGKVIREGRYKLYKTDITSRIVVDRKTGSSQKEVREVEFKYVKDGYWYYHKRVRVKQVYYDLGKKLKMKLD